MKSRQFCSVCKEWLEMEVVPTSDGEEDDGVIWFRCPQCQGFLPKLSGADLQTETKSEYKSEDKPHAGSETQPDSEPAPEPATDQASATSASPEEPDTDDNLPWDSPADMMAARNKAEPEFDLTDLDSIGDDLTVEEPGDEKAPAEAAEAEEAGEAGEAGEADEPLHQYAALLESKDQSDPAPYRPWESYEVGQCIHHQAWEDCGVVVAKEKLPGGRQVIKCYFKEAGVVRLIEMAPR